MRKLIPIAIVLLVIGTAWMLYLQYTNNKFQADLPKAPVPTSEPDPQVIETVETVEAPMTSEVLDPQASAERRTSDADAKQKHRSYPTTKRIRKNCMKAWNRNSSKSHWISQTKRPPMLIHRNLG